MNNKVILTESDLHRIVKESVMMVLNEVQFGGEQLHNTPKDWLTMAWLRDDEVAKTNRKYNKDSWDYDELKQNQKKNKKMSSKDSEKIKKQLEAGKRDSDNAEDLYNRDYPDDDVMGRHWRQVHDSSKARAAADRIRRNRERATGRMGKIDILDNGK